MRFEHRAVPIVLAAVLIDTIGFGIVMPVLPSLITSLGHVGIDDATRIAGYMLLAFALAQFVAGPVLGNLSDRFGRRPVLIASMLAFGIDYALMALAPTLAWLFLGRVIAGIAGAIYGPASSVIADVTPPDKRSAAFGYISAAFGIGFIIGPALGGLIAGLGPRAPFIAAALLALGNAAIMMIAMPESLAREHRRPFRWRDAHIVGAFKPLFESRTAAPLLLVALIWQLAHQVYLATWAFWATIRFDWSPGAIGISLAFVGLIMALVQALLVGPAIGRIGDHRALLVGLVSGAAGFFALAFVTAGWQTYAIMVLASLSGFVGPALNGLLSRLVGPDRQGALQGGLGSLGSVAAIVSPLMMTQTLAAGVEHGFPGAAFLLAGVLVLLGLFIVAAKPLGRASAAPETVAGG
ncbi:TCR/Tet family MFS transporter [Sphingomonas endolithica]|uniref:TCR/Tet family MFS transporter n=1 Tax=Sphingomonas endolithica TaxID=2972485 RepID=UPI0021AE5F6F|nr:TCR/Tet family MFS transporter [Sphingomonas sp. ZFBP2030]